MPLGKKQVLTGFVDKTTFLYDIYEGPRKIGFARATHEKIGNEIIILDERQIKVEKNGADDLLTTSLKCIIDSQYTIKFIEFNSHYKNDRGIKITGKVQSGDVFFFLESPEKRKVFTTPTNGKNFYIPATFIPALVQSKPVPNSVFTLPVLDINSLLVNDVKIVVEDIRPVKAGNTIMSIYKFRSGNSVWWSNEKGIVIKEENPSGLTLYSAPAQFAEDYKEKLLLDYTKLPLIQSNRLLSDPEKLTRMKVKIKGFKFDPKLYKNSVAALEDNTLVMQEKDPARLSESTYRLPYAGESFQQYLSPDAWISSNYKPLHDTGVVFAKTNNNDPFLFARYLTSYLFNLVKTEPTFFITDAESFLKLRRGDYAERSIMFATYARAGGLPTRLVGGFVYVHGYFYYHIWPEVWLEHWVPADPSFYQFPADVTHIPLREGDMNDIVSLIDDLKDVNIEIMEAL